MKTFRDSSNQQWTVFEVRRQIRADGNTGGDLSYLPSGYNSGWLCFENSAAKKRLTQYPDNWREFTDTELERLLGAATPAPRASLRLNDLADDSSSNSDLRPE